MRTFTAFFFLLFPIVCFSQSLPIDKITGKVTFDSVVEVKGGAKYEIYSKIKSWVSTVTGKEPDKRAIIKVDEKEAGRLIIQTRIHIKNSKSSTDGYYIIRDDDWEEGGFFLCNITFLIKDERYKWEATNFFHYGSWARHGMRDCGEVENEKCGSGKYKSPSEKQWNEIKEKLPEALMDGMFQLKKMVLKNDMDF